MIGFSSDVLNVLQIIVVTTIMLILFTYWGYGLVDIAKFKCHKCIIPMLGFIIDYFIYIVVEVPCCFFDISFSICTYIHVMLMFIYSVIVVYHIKRSTNNTLSNIYNKAIAYLLKRRKEILVIVLVFGTILTVTYLPNNYKWYLDVDQIWNCNNVGTILTTDHIFRHDAESGQYIGLNNYSLLFYTCFPYYASLCKVFYVKPVIMFYRIMSALFLCLYVLTINGIFETVFNEDKKKTSVANILFMILAVCPQRERGYLYWPIIGASATQGIIVTIFVPLITYLLLNYGKENLCKYWLIYAMTTAASGFVNRSSGIVILVLMAMAFIPIVVRIVKKRNYIDILKYALCSLIPLASIGVTYFI